MLRWLQTFPNFPSPNFERSCPCIVGLCIPSFLAPGRFSSLFVWVWSFCPSFPGSLKNLLLVDSLANFPTSEFEQPSSQFPGAWPILFHCHSPDWLTSQTWWGSFLLVLAAHHQIPRSCCETSSLHWPWHHQFGRSSFCAIGDPITRGCVLTSFRHGKPITRRSVAWERKLLKWLPECVENSWY